MPSIENQCYLFHNTKGRKKIPITSTAVQTLLTFPYMSNSRILGSQMFTKIVGQLIRLILTSVEIFHN